MSYDEQRMQDIIEGGLQRQKEMFENGIAPFETDKSKLLFVEVPDGITYVAYSKIDSKLFFDFEISNKIVFGETIVPNEDWLIAGPLHEVPEEVAAKLVDADPTTKIKGWYKYYSNYDGIDCDINSTTSGYDSIHSLARHLGFTDKQNIVVLYQLK